MAIVNRDLDPSQQRNVYQAVLTGPTYSGISAGLVAPGLGTGLTFPLCNISNQSQLIAADASSFGVSGSPVHSLWIYRFAGGFTSIAIGQTLAVTAYGTSGVQGWSLFAASSFQLQSGDQLVLYTQGSGSATAVTTVTLVVKQLQDIVTNFGV